MTPEIANWENEGDPTYSPAIRALTPTELAILHQMAEEFFGSVRAMQASEEDGDLEGLEMAETYPCEVA